MDTVTPPASATTAAATKPSDTRPAAAKPPGEQPMISERQSLLSFEQERRERLLRLIVPLFTVLVFVFGVLYTLRLAFSAPATLNWSDDAIEAVTVAFTLCAGASWLLLRRDRFAAASALFQMSYTTAVAGIAVLWNVGHGFNAFALGVLGAQAVVIVLTGALSEVGAIVAATALSVVVVLLGPAIRFGPSLATFTNTQPETQAAALLVLVDIAIGGVMIAMQRNYALTLRQINQLYVQITQVDNIKDLFITSVNHELRNPIMAMSGYIDLLRDRHGQMLADRQDEMLKKASGVGKRVVNLLMSILDARRLDLSAADFEPEVVNLAQAANDAVPLVNPFEGTVMEDQVRIAIPSNLYIWGETVRLQQIFMNLISNAVKYSPPGAPVEVRAQLVTGVPPAVQRFRSKDDKRVFKFPMVMFTVRDYGQGITARDAQILFRRFVRLPRDITSNVIGSGLGLHLCRVLAEAMGGAIGLESLGLEGDGTTFIVILPLPPKSSTQAHAASQAAVRAS